MIKILNLNVFLTSQVAQVVAYKLGIPLDMVTVQRTSTITSANSETTGGSVTSEAVCQVGDFSKLTNKYCLKVCFKFFRNKGCLFKMSCSLLLCCFCFRRSRRPL